MATTTLTAAGATIPLKPYVQNMMAAVIRGFVSTLRDIPDTLTIVEVTSDADAAVLAVNGEPIELETFPATILAAIIQAIVSKLNNVPAGEFRIRLE